MDSSEVPSKQRNGSERDVEVMARRITSPRTKCSLQSTAYRARWQCVAEIHPCPCARVGSCPSMCQKLGAARPKPDFFGAETFVKMALAPGPSKCL